MPCTEPARHAVLRTVRPAHARGRTAPGGAEQPTVCRAGYERHGHARRLRRAGRAIRHRRRDDAAPSGQGIRRHLHAGLDEVHRQFRAVLSVSVPEKVELTVVETDPAIKGAPSNQTKDAVTDTGLSLRVPQFIEPGEKIVVFTTDGKYAGRA